MKRVVWQYPIPTGQGLGGFEAFDLRLPRGARFLTVEKNGRGEAALYFEVVYVREHEEIVDEIRRFAYVPTGAEIPPIPTRFLGTFALGGRPPSGFGRFVVHVFEVAKW